MALRNRIIKSLTLTEKQWSEVHSKLYQEYHSRPSVLIIRSVMRRELGFTVRRHSRWIEDTDQRHFGYYRDEIVLDFYDEAKSTFFRLKYL
jgi:hypothetical protein